MSVGNATYYPLLKKLGNAKVFSKLDATLGILAGQIRQSFIITYNFYYTLW